MVCYTNLMYGGFMRYLKYILIFLLFVPAVFANYNDIMIANIEYDWINKSEVEKEAIISEVHDILFEDGFGKQKGFRKQYKSKIKDKNYRENYLAASAGYKEYKDNNISAFYYKNQKNIYMYALQDKKDITKNPKQCRRNS